MNKIYKVIWSKTRNCYVVVSELAKRNAKGGVSSPVKTARGLAALVLCACLAVGYGAPAAYADGTTTQEEPAGVAGSNVTRDTSSNASAWGYSTVATGINSTAWGVTSQAIGTNSTAFGNSSVANGINSLAALGGTADGLSSVAIGSGASTGDMHSIALGMDATASLMHSVAIGSYSVANRAEYDATSNNYTAYLGDASKTGVAWQATQNAIAIGASANDRNEATETRQITGVAAGTYDTDAVNVAQLKAAVAAGGGSGGGETVHFYSVNSEDSTAGNYDNHGATGTNALAAGVNAAAKGKNAISIGYGANGSEITSVGITSSMLPTTITNGMIRNFAVVDHDDPPNQINLKDYTGDLFDSNGNLIVDVVSTSGNLGSGIWTNLTDTQKTAYLLAELNYRRNQNGGNDTSIAIGDTTFALTGDVVIGSTAKALGNDAVVLGRGTTGFDNSVAIGTLAVAAPNSIAVGSPVTETKNDTTTTYTTNATANYSIAIGAKAEATATNAMALGIGASATAGQATAVGKGASASGTNSIALGNDSKGNTSSSIAIGNQANNSTNGFGDILLPNANIPAGGNVHVFKNKNNNNNYEVVTDDSGNPVYYDKKAIINEVEITYKWADLTDNEKKNVFKKELTLKMQDRDADPGLATYRQSITIGEASNALKEFDVVIGSTAVAAGSGTIAIGRVAKGLGNNNVAIGTSALTGSANAIAIGNASQTFGANGVAIGPSSQTSGSNALSVGYGAKAQQSSSVALGDRVTANGSNSIAIGNQGDNKLYTNAKGSKSIAIGSGAQALNNYAVALGESTKAYSKGSATVGYHSYAFGEDSTVFGHDSTAHGKASSVFGYLSTAGAVTLLSGDGNENYLSSWSRTRVVKEVYEDGGTTVDHYERQGNLSATDETHRNKYEIVTTKNGQVLALDREAAEQGTTQYFKVKEFRKIPWEGNALDPRDNEQSKGDVYWFVVDTSNSGKVNINNYGGQTEGGVAFGDYANAVGDKALAVGRSTIADGNDSAAIGMFANAYGTGSMAYGQNTSTGVQVETVYTNGNDNRHNTVLKTEEDGSVYRRTVSGGTALMNKLNQYIVEDLPTTDSGTITVKLNLDGSIAAYLKDGAPDKGTQAYVDYLLDPDNWNSGGNAKINNFSSLSESDQVSFKVGNKTVKTTAGNLMLTQGGVAFGSYAHAEGNNAMSIGRLAGAYDTNTMAIGLNANAWGRGGVAIGHNTFAGTDDFQVVADDYGGHTAVLKSNPDTGIVTAEANGAIRSVAIGSFSTASGSRSVAIGRETSAYGEFSLATGVYANAVGDRSTVYGNNAIAGSSAKVVDSGDGTYEVEPNALDTDGKPIKYALVKQEDGNEKKVAVIKASDGKYYEATLNENGRYYLPDDHSSASVYDSSQLIKNGMAVGAYTHAESSHAIAMGIASGAHDRNGMAIGLNANAWGRGGIAIGHNTITGTDDFKIVVDELGAHTAILNTDSNGEVISKPNDNRRAVAIGSFSVATGARAVAMGRETAAYGDDSLAVGVYANALGTESTVFGNYAMAGTQATVKASGDSYVIEPAALDTDGKPMQFARVETDGETRKIPVIKGTDGNYYEAEKGADGRYYLPANPGSPYDSSQLVQNGMAVGPYTHAEDTHAIAMGVATGAYDKNSTAVGLNASAWGEGSMAYGHNAFAGTDGVEVKHDGNVYTAELVKDSTTDIVTAAGKEGVIGAIAFGSYAHASGDRALAIGRAAGAYGDISTAMGLYSNAYGEGALAVGHNTVTGAAVLIERDGDSDHHKATLVRKENNNGGDLVLRDKDGNAVVKDTDGKYYTAQLVDGAYQKTETTVDAKNLAEGGIAMGSYSHAGGDRAIAIGRAAGADSKNSTAIGLYANAYGEGAMAIGHNTVAGAEVRTDNGHQIMALYDSDAADEPTSSGTGRRNKVNGTEVTGGIAIGSYAHALGDKAISVGRDSGAWGNNSSVFGLDSNAYGEGSIALGHGVTAGDSTNRYALFEVSQENAAAGNFDLDESGYSSNPVGAVAVGSYAKATGRGSLAIGRNTETDSAYTTALGVRAKVMENAENAIAIGREAQVGAITEGRVYGGLNSIAMGTLTNVKGQNSIAIGTADMLNDAGTEIVAPGERKATTITGDSSVAIGKYDTITGNNSIAIGSENVVKGDGSGAIGDPNTVNGNSSYILGNNSSIGSISTEASTGGDTGNGSGEGNESGAGDGTGSTSGESSTSADIPINNAFITGNNSSVLSEGGLIYGSNATITEKAGNGLALGNGTTVSVPGAVALGSTTVAQRAANNGGDANNTGYDPSTRTNYAGADKDTATWLSTLGAVSVGGAVDDPDKTGAIGTAATATRQITGVAAGTADTDAVNVAQLKLVQASAGGASKFGGDNTTATENIITVDGDELLNVKGGVGDATDLTDNNIGVVADTATNTLSVKLSNKINLKQDGFLSIGQTTGGGQTVVDQNGITIYPATSASGAEVTKFTKNGISAGKQRIQYVNAGEELTDAVNVSQLQKARTKITKGANVTSVNEVLPTGVDGNYSYTIDVDDLAYKANGANETTTKNVKLADGLNFVNGTNTTAVVEANGIVKINATHNKIETATVTPATDDSNAMTAVLKDADNNETTVALQNTYTKSATFDTTEKKATFTRNDGGTYALDLSAVSMSDYRLIKNGSTTDGSYAVGADGTVTLDVEDQLSGTKEQVKITGLATQSDLIHDYSVKSTDPTTDSNYDNKGATGINSLAAGVSAKAARTNAIAIGTGATAGTISTGLDSIAVGTSSNAIRDNGIAIGSGATAQDNGSIAIGAGAVAKGMGAIVLGSNGAQATGRNAMAWGSGTAGDPEDSSKGTMATAWGSAIASGIRATAWGGPARKGAENIYTTASGGDSTAWGLGNIASGESSTAWGHATTASGQESTAWGRATTASGQESTAWGGNTVASKEVATAWGKRTVADGLAATAHGYYTVAKGSASTSWGFADGEVNVKILADGYGATAWGVALTHDLVAQGTGATAFGYETQATNQFATAWGQRTQATGEQATSFGTGTVASGGNATAFGESSIAGGVNATAFGTQSKAFGTNSLAALGGTTGEGSVTTDSETGAKTVSITKDAKGALAIGEGAKAQESYTYAIGQNAVTSAADTIAFGNDASATVAGGVALGSNSSATIDKGVTGYDPATQDTSTKSDATWKSTLAAVSVGGDGQTRQITNVAAGYQDTDAVNVAQLKAARTELQDGTNTTVTKQDGADGHTIYKVNAYKSVVQAKAGDTNVTVAPTVTDDGLTTTYDISVKDMHVKEGVANYGTDGKAAEGTITLTHEDETTATITGLKNTYTTVTKDATAKTVTFSRNDGETQTVSLSDLGGSSTDYAIDKQSVAVDADGKVTLKATDRMDSDKTYNVEITGVATKDDVAKKVKFADTTGNYFEAGLGEQVNVVGEKGVTVTSNNSNNTYTIGIDGETAAAEIPLSYKANNGSALSVTLDKGLDFTNGTNTTAEVAADGVVKINVSDTAIQTAAAATDKYVRSGVATYGTDGKAAEGTATLTVADDSGNTSEATITGLKNTYTTVTKDATAKTVTFSRNDGETQTVSLSDLGGSSTDYALDAQVVSVASDGTVTLAGKDRMNTSDTYNVKITGVATKDDVAKKVKFKDGSDHSFEAGLGDEVTIKGINGIVTDAQNTNTYTIGIDGETAAAEIPLSYKANNGSALSVTLDKGLDFTNGTNTTAEVAADGVVKINVSDTAIQTAAAATDKYVRSGVATYGTDGKAAEGTATLTIADESGNTTTATITGLKNTYTTVTKDAAAKTVTFSRNDGVPDTTISLGDLGGSSTDYAIEEQSVAVDADGKVTLKATDRMNSGNTYNVEITGVATKDDVAKKVKFADTTGNYFEAGLGEQVNVVGEKGVTVTSNNSNNTYTIGIDGETAAAEIPLSYKANGSNGQKVKLSDGLDFTNGTNTTATVEADGKVVINVSDTAIQTAAAATDKYVRSGVATYGTDGKAAEGTATLTIADESGNTTTATITGLKNTYTTVTKDAAAKTVTFSRNDGVPDTTISLGDLGGSSTDYAIDKQSVAVDANGKVTLKATDRMDSNNTYNVEITGVATKDDVAKKIKFADTTGNYFEAGLGEQVNVVGEKGVTVASNNSNNTYTIGISGTDAAKEIPLSYKANGTNGQTVTLDKGLDFTNGTNTTAEVAADGVVKINAYKSVVQAKAGDTNITVAPTVTDDGFTTTYDVSVKDMHVKEGVANYGTDGKAAEGTITLTHEDETTATITGLKNTYTTVTKDATAKTVTFSRNDGETQTVSLSDLGGSSTDYAIDKQSVSVDENGKVTLKATDRMDSNNTYNVEITGVATKDDVAKKIKFADTTGNYFEAGLGEQVNVVGEKGVTVASNNSNNTYTIGIDGADAAKEIPLTYKSNGDAGTVQSVKLSDGLDFTNGTNTTAEVAADGVVKINVSDTAIQTAAAKTDKYVRSGVATYGTDGKAAEGTATLTVADDSGNTSEATITGLKNTYTTVTKDAAAKTVTFSRNDGVPDTTISLGDLGGSSTDYRLVKNVSSTDGSYKMADDGTVTLVVQDQMNPENTEQVTISGLTTKADVAAAKAEVKAGTNVSVATDTKTAEDGHTIYTVNADGASASAGSDAVKVTKGTKDAETNITDYAIDLSDAAKTTLNKVETTGLTFAGDTGTSNAIKLGDTLNVKGGATGALSDNNIGVEAEGNALKVKLAKDVKDIDSIQINKTAKVGDNIAMDGDAGTVTVGSLADGGTVLSQKGIRIVPTTGSDIVQFTTEGISAGGQKIENVADGEADTDAVNVRQLTKAAAAAKTEVAGGTNIASVDPSTGADGQTIYTVNADGTTVSAADGGAVTVTAGAKDTTTNITDYKVDLSAETKVTLNKVETTGLTFAGDTGTSNAIKLGDTLNVKGGATGALSDNNIGVEADGNALKVKLAKDIEDIDSIQVNKSVTVGDGITIDGESTKLTVGGNITVDGANTKLTVGDTMVEDKKITMGDTLLDDTGMTITGGPTLTKTSADMNGLQIKNVADGEDDTDAVNVSQLNKAAAAAKTEVEGGTNIASVTNRTGADGHTIYTVNADGAKVSAGSAAVSVTKADEKDSNNIYDYSVDLSDATKATLNKVETTGLTFAGDTGTSNAIKLGDTLNVTGGATGTLSDDNIGVEAEGNALKVKLADNINLTKAGSVTIGTAAEGATVISQKGIRIIPATGDDITEFTTENISAGGQQIHKVKAGTADDDAVNVRQLNEAKEEAIGSVKLKFRGDNGDEVVRGNNETLQVVGDGSNITTESEDNKIKVELSKDLKVDSVTAGNTVINNDGVTADKVTVGDTVIEDGKVSVGDTTIEENKIAMGDTLITNDSVTTKSVTADEVTAGDTTINNDGVTTNSVTAGDTTINSDGVTTNKVTAGDTTINNDGVTTNKVTVGDTTVNSDGLTIDGGPSVTRDGIDAGGKKITNVAAGTADTDAVNVAQLREATAGSKTEVAGGTNIASVEHTTGEKGQSIYTVNADGAKVSAGSDAVTVTAGDKDANNVTDYKVDLSETAKASLDKVEKDGLTFKGDTGTSNKIKLGDTLNIKGGASGALSDGNIGVEGSGDTLNIKLAKDIKGVDTVQVNKSLKAGDNITIDGENTKLTVGDTTIEDNKMTMGDTVITNDSVTTKSVTANTFTAGDTTISNDGLAIADGPSVTKMGVDAGGQKVTNVAPGEAETDAANMGQLYQVAENAGAAINNVSNEVNRLDGRMKKGLAGAAALAALHPMDFDPDDKLTFAAGMGNYRGQNAAAIGAFYRPDEKVMFSVGGTVGNGENMVNAGVSFALDRVNRVTTSRTAMAHEIVELKKHIAHQDSQIAQLTQLVNKLVGPEQQIQNTSMFPDVPENHWAYAYLEDLQQRGIVEGYPGGRFIGDRAMTRYEFAAMLDRALQKGVQLDARLTKEFEPELGRIYVERIHGQDNDRHKIERVRVNNTDTRTRDVYGTKIS